MMGYYYIILLIVYWGYPQQYFSKCWDDDLGSKVGHFSLDSRNFGDFEQEVSKMNCGQSWDFETILENAEISKFRETISKQFRKRQWPDFLNHLH